jgi:hypothetical protein
MVGKDLEGSGRSLIQVLCRQLFGKSGERHALLFLADTHVRAAGQAELRCGAVICSLSH